MNHLHFIDYLIIFIVLGITLWLGFRFAKRQKTTENYFLSKGNFPAWALGLSLLSTLISSVTFLGYPSQGYNTNWIYLVQGFMVPIVLVGTIWFIVPLYRKVIGLSTYEYFEKRFGGFARYYSSSSFIIRQFAGMGTVLFLIAVAIHEMTTINPFIILAVVGFVLVLVNLKGGMQAVIWLDVFQGFMLFASGIICLAVILFSIKGGVPEAIKIATENNRTGFGPYNIDLTQLTLIVMIINGAFYAIQKYGTDQTVVQRYLTAKTDKAAEKASLMGILLTVPIWTIFMFIGTALFVFYKQSGTAENMKAETVFPHFIMTQLPIGVVGFIVAALISAAICSLSADLNSLAAVGIEDYYKKLRPGKTDKQYLYTSKAFVVISGLLAIAIGALYLFVGNEGILGVIFTIYAIFSGGIVGIFLLGLFSARANRQGVNIGIIVCILFTAYAFLTSTPIGIKDPTLLLDLGNFNFAHHKLMLGVYSHLIVIVVGYIASLFFPKPVLEENLLFSSWKKNRNNENTHNNRNNFYPQDAVHVPGFIATMRLSLRRTLVLRQFYSALKSATCSTPILSAVRFVRYSAFISRKGAKFLNQKTQSDHSNFLCALAPLRLCVRPLIFLSVFVSPWFNSLNAQQNTENQYRKPLKEVLNDIQKRYGVQIKYDEKLVADKFVNYADWRYRTGVDATLDNVLSLFDMVAKKEKDKVYKLSNYEYYRWLPADGWAELDRIASQYKNVEEWEKRKTDLKECLLEATQLNHLPASPGTAPIRANFRKMKGYTIENLAIEILPGVWVNGSLYKPANYKGKIPVVIHPQGHWDKHRYRPDCQYTSAAIAKMGAMIFNYDMFAWGESTLQFKYEYHRQSLAMTLQLLAGKRILDYLLSQKDADTSRVAIIGGSGGGTQTVFMTAIDDRIKVSAPVVNLSSYFYGGCPCESGPDVHGCTGRTDNMEIAAMTAPKPQLVVSDGGDWTDRMPEHDFPYLKKMYSWYGKPDNVINVHLPNDKHDFGFSKRKPVYEFFAKYLGLNLKSIQAAEGSIVDTTITLEPENAFYVFGDKGEKLPAHAVKGFENLEKLFAQEIEKTRSIKSPSFPDQKNESAKTNQRYKIGLIDLMLLKRQKLGAITLTGQLKADGVEVDMGGLGTRPTFDNQLLTDSVRNLFLKTAKENNVEIFSLAMTGYYAQSFCGREEYKRSIEDCIKTMELMNVKTAFLPLGVQCDLKKNPSVRDSVVTRLKVAGKIAEAANVSIGIETALSATEEVKLLKEINSPAIKIYFNFSNPLKEGRDLINELKILGKDRICMIHATNKDSVWLENDPQIDMYKVKKTLDEIGWSGWLVIERSRDAKKPSDTKYNYGANTAYLKKVFQ